MYPDKEERKIRKKQIDLEVDAVERMVFQGNKRLRELNFELRLLEDLDKLERKVVDEP